MIDHLLWAVPELEEGRRQLARRTGVDTVAGGRHPGVGTHNALLGLGGERYLEILAPDPGQDRFTGLGRHLDGLRSPRLLTWCVRSHDLADSARLAERAGLRPGKITAMSRRRPDGRKLAWKLLFLEDHPWGELIPFFIDWQTSIHPSGELPGGCRLVRLTLQHPRAAALAELLPALGLDADGGVAVESGPAPGLRAELRTPAGTIRLESPAAARGGEL